MHGSPASALKLAALLVAGCTCFEARAPERVEDLSEFFRGLGLPQYGTPAFLGKLYEVLGYDALSDLAHIYEDDEFEELGMSRAEAGSIQRAARIHLLELFLQQSGAGEAAEALYNAGYEDPTSLPDIERQEAQDVGLTDAQWKQLTGRAPRPNHDEL